MIKCEVEKVKFFYARKTVKINKNLMHYRILFRKV